MILRFLVLHSIFNDLKTGVRPARHRSRSGEAGGVGVKIRMAHSEKDFLLTLCSLRYALSWGDFTAWQRGLSRRRYI